MWALMIFSLFSFSPQLLNTLNNIPYSIWKCLEICQSESLPIRIFLVPWDLISLFLFLFLILKKFFKIFSMWIIFKVLIEFVTILPLFYVFFFLALWGMWYLSPLTKSVMKQRTKSINSLTSSKSFISTTSKTCMTFHTYSSWCCLLHLACTSKTFPSCVLGKNKRKPCSPRAYLLMGMMST